MNANEKLTALADEVRELSGTTTTKGLDDMKNDVDAANSEIAEQVALISQITAALEGKTSGGGGEDVTEETNTYTEKIASLESAVTALETELAGKASGGSGGSIETCTLTINMDGLDYNPFCFITVLGNSGLGFSMIDSSTTLTNVVKNSEIMVMVPESMQRYELNFPHDGAMRMNSSWHLLLNDETAVMIYSPITGSGSITFF